MSYVMIVIAAYCVGSIPCGLLIGRWLKGIDLREFGSKNIGATNAYRILGPRPALLVFLCDAAKGLLGVYFGAVLGATQTAEIVGGMAAIAGHNWSVFLGFKGGRGVATGLGVIAFLSPKVTVVVFCVWVMIVYLTKYVSLGSIVAAALVPFLMWYWNESPELIAFGFAAAVFVIYKHRPNIQRLLRGEELKIKAPKPDKQEG